MSNLNLNLAAFAFNRVALFGNYKCIFLYLYNPYHLRKIILLIDKLNLGSTLVIFLTRCNVEIVGVGRHCTSCVFSQPLHIARHLDRNIDITLHFNCNGFTLCRNDILILRDDNCWLDTLLIYGHNLTKFTTLDRDFSLALLRIVILSNIENKRRGL